MKKVSEAELIDYINDELAPADRARITAMMSEDQQLTARFQALQRLRAGVESFTPQPSAAADERFNQFLADITQERPAKVRRLPVWQSAAAAAVLLLTFTLGWYFGTANDRDVSRQLAASRSLMMELMNDQRMSARLEATAVALEIPIIDAQVINNLGYLLREDENTNVRLAALEALSSFVDEPLAREEMLTAMEVELPEIVRLQLIDLLVRVEEDRVIPFLEELIENDTVPRFLRDAAQMGTFKLI